MTAEIGNSGGKGRIRSLSRRGTRASKGPAIARLNLKFHEPTICERCGAVYHKRTWRRAGALPADLMKNAEWACCPACVQVDRGEAYGRVLLRGEYLAANRNAIRRRIQNVSRRAAFTQPERKLVALNWDGSLNALEVLTTSQKLAHRIACEIQKAFGGQVGYSWSDGDGGLLATWWHEPPAA